MFRLERAQAQLQNFNPRAEKHGQENKPAGDLKIALPMHSSILDEFAPHLRELLFCHPSEAGPSDSLRLSHDDDKRYTAVRFPKIGPLKYDEAFPGYQLSIARGMNLRKPLVLDDVELDGFTFEPQEGGSVITSFRVKCHPDDVQFGRLCTLIQEQIEITLTPPSADAKQKQAEEAGQESLELTAPLAEDDGTPQADATTTAAAEAIATHVAPALRHAVIEGIEAAEDRSINLWTHVVFFTDGLSVTLQKYAYRLDLDEVHDELRDEHGIDATEPEGFREKYEAGAAVAH